MVKVKRPKRGIPSIMRTFGAAFKKKKHRRVNKDVQYNSKKPPSIATENSIHTISIPFGGMNKKK